MRTRRAQLRLSKLEKLFFIMTAALGLLLAALPLWWLSLEADPAITIPAAPPLPRPNAYNYYAEAASLLETREVLYYATASNADTKNYPINLGNGIIITHPFTAAEKRALLQGNQEALKVLRQGFAFAFRQPPARSLLATFPQLSYCRALAHALILEGQVKAQHGDGAGAAHSYLDAFRFGGDIARGGPLICLLVSLSCQGTAHSALLKTVDHLNAAEARAVLRRLERISARRVSLAEALQEEKWRGQASLMEAFRQPNWRDQLQQLYTSYADQNENKSSRMGLLIASKRALMHNYTRGMEAALAAARQPYAVNPRLPLSSSDPLTHALLQSVVHSPWPVASHKAHHALLVTALALRAYRLEQGMYPNSLAALAPRYLAQLPDDPFAGSGTLRYRKTKDKYLLYSLGPDGKDDQGKPLGTPSQPRTFNHPTPESQGDLVLGVNTAAR